MPATRSYRPSLPPLSLNRTRAADDTDGATQQTVRKMCDLIAESVKDPVVQACAAYAKKRFARGSSDPAAILWGVFWYIKHCVKFRSDEGTMLQVGETGSQDLLIAPAVLVRMDKPSEDCDGFTMLGAAMLTILGVPVYITTVATDLDDPRRWSHVFLCANVNGRIVPLDTSHGKAPGWMVPRDRINRFQTWTLDGRPADVKIPNFQGLHGYIGLGAVARGRRRGMGEDSFVDDPGAWITTEINSFENGLFPPAPLSSGDIIASTGGDVSGVFAGMGASDVVPYVAAPSGYTGPTVIKGTASTPAAPAGYNWATLINSSGNQLAKILTVAQGGSSQTLANGNQLLFGAGQSNLMGSLSSSTGLSSTTLIIAALGIGALLLLKK